MIDLTAVEAAARRLTPHLRHTPLLDACPLPGGAPGGRLFLKLENLQVTGSFKSRGAANKVLALHTQRVQQGLVSASGGNHGLGVAFAGRLVGAPVTIYLPANVPPAKAAKLELWGARLIWEGELGDDADRGAREAARREGMTYIHSFADEAAGAPKIYRSLREGRLIELSSVTTAANTLAPRTS